MWVIMSQKYRAQREEYRLKESCEDCRHFCAIRESCAVLYPVEAHRKEKFLNAKDGERLYFCKMFEVKEC